MPNTGARIAPSVFTNGKSPICVMTETHKPPITKPQMAVIRPPMRKSILLGSKFAKSYAGGMKLATMLIPTVAAKNAKAAMMVRNILSTLATIAVGSAIYSPKIAIVPPVIISVMNEKKTTLPTKPHRLPFRISSSLLTKRAKSPKLITTAAKYPTMIEKTATKALIAPRPSNSPERLPPEKIEPA